MTPTAYRFLDRPVRWLSVGIAFTLCLLPRPPWRVIDRLADIARAVHVRAGRDRNG